MSGYTKVFGSMLDSTIWNESDTTRIVWVTLMLMKDRDGMVEASIPGLANRARVTVEKCEEALAVLMAPDRFSRTQDHEGRRIVEIDGGWRLINAERYRDKLGDEEQRARAAARQKRFRDRHRPNRDAGGATPTVTPETSRNVIVRHADPDPDTDPDKSAATPLPRARARDGESDPEPIQPADDPNGFGALAAAVRPGAAGPATDPPAPEPGPDRPGGPVLRFEPMQPHEVEQAIRVAVERLHPDLGFWHAGRFSTRDLLAFMPASQTAEGARASRAVIERRIGIFAQSADPWIVSQGWSVKAFIDRWASLEPIAIKRARAPSAASRNEICAFHRKQPKARIRDIDKNPVCPLCERNGTYAADTGWQPVPPKGER